MSQACHVCNHDNRLEIDRQLVKGIAHSKIAQDFNVSMWSVRAHAESHLSRQLVKSNEMKEAMQSSDLVNEIRELVTDTKDILTIAKKEKKYNLALNAINSAKGVYELLCKIATTMYQIQIAELQSQQNEQEDTHNVAFQAGMQRLTDSELVMYMALIEKMAGDRTDDVIPAVLRELNDTFIPIVPKPEQSRRSRRNVPAGIVVDEVWNEEREQEAIEEEKALALEPEGIEPLDLDSLSQSESRSGAGVWGNDKHDPSGFQDAVKYGRVSSSRRFRE